MGEILPPSASPPVLVVTADTALREVLADLLGEEGYTSYAVSSPAEALALVEERAFSMILAEVFAAASPHAWDDARTLLRSAWPAPVGLLLTHPQVHDALTRAGFAFVQRMPFEIDELLARVAAATARPLSSQHERWMRVVERSCCALADANWDALLDLCVEDVICYPPQDSVVSCGRKLEGKAAVRAYIEAAAVHYQNLAFADFAIYPRSRGLIARFTTIWLGLDDRPHQATTTLRLCFLDDRIRQVSLRVNLVYARERLHTLPA